MAVDKTHMKLLGKALDAADKNGDPPLSLIQNRIQRAALLNPNAHLRFPIAPPEPSPAPARQRQSSRKNLTIEQCFATTHRLRAYAQAQYPQYRWHLNWHDFTLQVACTSGERPGKVSKVEHAVTTEALQELVDKGQDMVNVAAYKLMEV